MTHDEDCDELEREVDRFADVLAVADFSAVVPSCPEWDIGDLALHLGRVHRWADKLVRTRSTSALRLADFTQGTFQVDDEWLRTGGYELATTLRSADPDESMWAWGADQHVRFWSRRQLHETLVHRVDLELAMGVTSHVSPGVALDAVDEFLANLMSDGDINLKARPDHPGGERLQIRTVDGTTSWNVQLTADGYEFVDAPEENDAAILGDPAELLALLLRRRPVDQCVVVIEGDASLVDLWLSGTAFL